jgi:hypothetical protein
MRLSSELVQMLAGGEESVLNRIFSVGAISQHPISSTVKRG